MPRLVETSQPDHYNNEKKSTNNTMQKETQRRPESTNNWLISNGIYTKTVSVETGRFKFATNSRHFAC